VANTRTLVADVSGDDVAADWSYDVAYDCAELLAWLLAWRVNPVQLQTIG
jgi:hypothetical protein